MLKTKNEHVLEKWIKYSLEIKNKKTIAFQSDGGGSQ